MMDNVSKVIPEARLTMLKGVIHFVFRLAMRGAGPFCSGKTNLSIILDVQIPNMSRWRPPNIGVLLLGSQLRAIRSVRSVTAVLDPMVPIS